MNGDELERIEKLSEGQRICLRLVFRHMSSKQIARALEISRHTVDQRVARACNTLGVSTRVDAARMVAEYERLNPYEPIIYDTSHIADPARVGSELPRFNYGAADEDLGKPLCLSDNEATYDAFGVSGLLSRRLPLPQYQGAQNDLSVNQRLTWAALIWAASILVMGALIAALEALGRLI